MTPEEDRYFVLGNVLEGLALLEGSAAFAALIPEIRSNLVMALAEARGPEDVAGVPGRITVVFGQPRAAARPAFGASRYTSRIVLAARRALPGLRAGLEIKYRPELVATLERLGLRASPLEGVLAEVRDPEGLAKALARSFEQAYVERERVSVAYTEGGHAREGAIILVGESAVAVARKALEIAEAFAG